MAGTVRRERDMPNGHFASVRPSLVPWRRFLRLVAFHPMAEKHGKRIG